MTELIELDYRPEKDHIWAAAETHAEHLDLTNHRPEHPDRELWYVPTVTIWSAARALGVFEEYGITTVYDLGSGDCRFSLWLDRQGYDVVAYELNEELANAVRNRFYLGDMEIRVRDYYEDYDSMLGEDVAVVAFGGTNELPYVPDTGVGIEGYSEIGRTVYHDGDAVGFW